MVGTYASLTSGLETLVKSVQGYGTVHKYWRWTADQSTYLDLFKTNIDGVGQIRTWLISLAEGSPIVETNSEFGYLQRTYTFVITGILQMNDSSNSEATFVGLIELLLEALKGESTMGVAGVIPRMIGPSVVRLLQHRQFGSVLCHYAEIVIPIVVAVAE